MSWGFYEVYEPSCHHLQDLCFDTTGIPQILLWIRAIHSVPEKLSISAQVSLPTCTEQQPQNHRESPGFPGCRKEAGDVHEGALAAFVQRSTTSQTQMALFAVAWGNLEDYFLYI